MAVAIDTLQEVREKVEAGERLDFEDGVALFESDDLLGLGELADLARRVRGGGDEVYFVQNINLYQTNVCRVKCKFCAFARTNKQEDAFTNGSLVLGTTWQANANTLKTNKVPVETVEPKEGSTGWSDTWMVIKDSKHPNCAYKWMDWIVSPKVNAEVAEFYGEAPANRKACDLTTDKDHCKTYHALDEKYAPYRTDRSKMPDTTREYYAASTGTIEIVPDDRILTWDNARLGTGS